MTRFETVFYSPAQMDNGHIKQYHTSKECPYVKRMAEVGKVDKPFVEQLGLEECRKCSGEALTRSAESNRLMTSRSR